MTSKLISTRLCLHRGVPNKAPFKVAIVFLWNSLVDRARIEVRALQGHLAEHRARRAGTTPDHRKLL